MIWIRRINIGFAILVVLAPMAHVLELPNKLALDAALWLAVQQHLYRGWGPFLGGPTEIGALLTSIWLVYFRRRSSTVLAATALASAGYAGMLAAFFLLNKPVNVAIVSWTPTSLPLDWAAYRARWEAGHAIAALLSVVSLAALVWAFVKEQQARSSTLVPA
jgi:hypothetical protein